MSVVLVTGGAGFIGSHLVDALVKSGRKVRVIDDYSTGKLENLADVGDRIELIPESICHPFALEHAMANVECVFHLAAMVSVPQSIVDPRKCHEICASGTLNVLLAAKAAGVRRVVFAGSSSAYGDAGNKPIGESTTLSPISPYAAAKLAGEHYCEAFAATSPLETVRLRFFNVFGPRQDPSSPYSGVISIFSKCAKEGKKPTIFGDGKQTRDFVFVSDVVDALMKAASTPRVSGKVFNIGSGKAYSLLDLLDALSSVTGKTIEPNFAPPRVGDILHSCASIELAQKELDFQPKVSLVDGLQRCTAATA